MANGQDQLDAASLNAILPAGFTPVCEGDQKPKGADRAKRQTFEGTLKPLKIGKKTVKIL